VKQDRQDRKTERPKDLVLAPAAVYIVFFWPIIEWRKNKG